MGLTSRTGPESGLSPQASSELCAAVDHEVELCHIICVLPSTLKHTIHAGAVVAVVIFVLVAVVKAVVYVIFLLSVVKTVVAVIFVLVAVVKTVVAVILELVDVVKAVVAVIYVLGAMTSTLTHQSRALYL